MPAGSKVCILAAGRGTRLGALGRHANKALVPVGYRPAISRVIEKFPRETEFVVAVGHRAALVRDYLAIAHPETKTTFVDVDNYQGPGSGPGYSLLCCRRHLEEPFVVTTCDTLVEEAIPDVGENWIGVALHPRPEDYCSVGLSARGSVTRIDYKEKVEGNQPFIGIAGIRDVDAFWAALADDRTLIFGEHQIANGLQALIPRGLQGHRFTWFDTGTLEGLREASRYFGTDFRNFDKDDEFIYFVNGGVVKFFADAEIARRRVERNRLLGDLCPAITAWRPHFYRYDMVEGQELAEVVDNPTFARFLEWCREKLWIPVGPDVVGQPEFRALCRTFYKEKTEERLEKLYETTGIVDREEVINGYRVPALRDLLKRIDWEWLSDGVPVRFHGDLHFDNTIVPADARHGEFKLLDWRQDFAGRLEYGDWYYDLAKIQHALIISHDQIKRDQYGVEVRDDQVRYHYLTRSELIACQGIMRAFVERVGLDYGKVQMLTRLIYLNMSPLHHHPFNLLLYYLGKLGLYQLLEEKVGV